MKFLVLFAIVCFCAPALANSAPKDPCDIVTKLTTGEYTHVGFYVLLKKRLSRIFSQLCSNVFFFGSIQLIFTFLLFFHKVVGNVLIAFVKGVACDGVVGGFFVGDRDVIGGVTGSLAHPGSRSHQHLNQMN